MRLTAELVARVACCTAGDQGLPPGIASPDEADYDVAVRTILAAQPADAEVWVFAFGSLIWKPGCDFVERRIGVARGWHRSFCLGWDRRFRGSDGRPGLMLSLDRGG